MGFVRGRVYLRQNFAKVILPAMADRNWVYYGKLWTKAFSLLTHRKLLANGLSKARGKINKRNEIKLHSITKIFK
jgi:hypothetical protein